MQYLLKYATPRQAECINAYIEYGSSRKAAAALGVNKTNINSVIAAVKKKAALQGESPEHQMNKPVPDGFKVKGVSTYYNADGEVTGQWVKSSADEQRRYELMLEAVEALKEELPRYAVTEYLGKDNCDLLNMFVITDFHLGMKSWHEETGADYDLDIAENLLVGWFGKAITLSPEADKAILANIGDFMHWDGMEAVTPQHKHILDADTRFQKLVRVSIRVIRKVINMLLEKHKEVHVLMADANHDPASGAWMRELLASVYQDEPRITVDTSADSYYCYEHGSTSLFFHHGHKRGIADADKVFAGKYRQVFGRTKYAYAHLGHLHSNEVKESQLMIVERHRTLSAPDAYAAKGGWISGRDAKVITYSKRYGEVSRVIISPDMVKGE